MFSSTEEHKKEKGPPPRNLAKHQRDAREAMTPQRDPMAKKNTDKARFFHGHWREAHPTDYKTHEEKEKG